jgi:hypothetical protein
VKTHTKATAVDAARKRRSLNFAKDEAHDGIKAARAAGDDATVQAWTRCLERLEAELRDLIAAQPAPPSTRDRLPDTLDGLPAEYSPRQLALAARIQSELDMYVARIDPLEELIQNFRTEHSRFIDETYDSCDRNVLRFAALDALLQTLTAERKLAYRCLRAIEGHYSGLLDEAADDARDAEVKALGEEGAAKAAEARRFAPEGHGGAGAD